MRFILLSLLFLLGMTVGQKLHNDRLVPSHHALSGEAGQMKESTQRKVQQSDIKTRSPFSSDRSQHKKFGASNRVPPYAVQMEPLFQYSQPDPLFKDTLANESSIADSKSNFKNIPTNKINKIEKREHNYGVHFGDNEHESTHNTEFSSYGSYVESSYPEEPEPIIEIIIKESNQTVAAPPPAYKPPPKKKKEPVQVFYVKYKKDPSAAYGEDKIIYEAPIPAVTPPTNHESSAEETEEETLENREEVTLPPAPSTTLKAIIRPDSEIYHGSGLHITFGGSKREDESSHRHPGSEEQQSAPQASVLLPDRNAPPLISRSGNENQPPKRHPSHFEAPSNRNGGGSSAESRISYRPPAPTSFQQTPQYPAQPFRPTHNNLNNQYFTLPLHLRNPNFQANSNLNPPRSPQPQHHHNRFPAPNFHFRPEHQNAGFSSASQPYQTIKHSDSQAGHFTTASPHNPSNLPFHSPSDQLRMPLRQSYNPGESQGPAAIRNRPNLNSTDQQQYRDQIEQLNRLQQQQQRLQAQIFQNNENKPNFVKQSSDSAPEIIKSISPDDIGFPNHRPEFPPKPIPNFSPPVSDPTFPRANLIRTESRTTSSTSLPAAIESSTPVPVSKDEKKRKEEKKNQNVAALPKEVPDDLREQLLSSGILNNADIQILDYDKIGDIPVENLPPEALANFQAVAGSEQVPVATPYKLEEDSLPAPSEKRNILVKPDGKGTDLMEMKVVRFNPESNGGSKIADKYMKEGATRLEPVVLNDSKYNRYLPLKISGTQFPVPDVPELQGRNVTSVVILAPVDYEFLERRDREEEGRLGRRSASPLLEVQGVHFVAGDVLKDLVKIPNTENYKKWLDKENKTAIEKQSVVLLVVEPTRKSNSGVKDIFMYDIATQRVSKLKGELSSTFVKVAESNSQNRDLEEISDNPSAPGGDFTIKNTSEIPP